MSPTIGQILEEETPLSLEELCRACAAEREVIVELVEEGVLEVDAGGLHFTGRSLRRARMALRLQRDLGVNVAGVALVIELLERIEVLERGQRKG